MLHKYIVFKTHPINITNLFIGMTIESLSNFLYRPCYSILDGKFFHCAPNLFANFCEDAERSFRYLIWDQSNIDKLVSIANETEKSIVFGSHNNDQIKIIQNALKDQCYVISIDYTEQSYQILLDNLVSYHLYLNNLTDYEHYVTEFDRMQLIPKSSFCPADYNINFADFFNKEKMQQHFQNLKFQFPNTFYDNWLISAMS